LATNELLHSAVLPLEVSGYAVSGHW
jgi:hypothetical protein